TTASTPSTPNPQSRTRPLNPSILRPSAAGPGDPPPWPPPRAQRGSSTVPLWTTSRSPPTSRQPPREDFSGQRRRRCSRRRQCSLSLPRRLPTHVWKSVALWTVVRKKNSQQINVQGQKVLQNQAQKHPGRKLEGTS
ncbi:Transcription factor ILR3, partial [Zea mays]